jgi:UDP-N-acetylglucosamine/UDP-N-acetylgalactosamine diphosphorylase
MKQETADALTGRGVHLIEPQTIEIGAEVDASAIGPGTTIHAGCRIRGAQTTIGADCVLGAEAPMTVDNCQLGSGVELAGGFATESVFLDGSKAGSGTQIRAACLLEEGANVAHAVGLKQTILMPWATLGSLINFCDALLAGGTGPKDHAEVGSGFIHFNFTPKGSKATASLFGDVPRGVFLRQRRVFLGGNGGAVGPVHVGFGATSGAGVILRTDVPDNQLVLDQAVPQLDREARRHRVIDANLAYIGNLIALRTWYSEIRSAFFERSTNGQALYAGAQRVFAAALQERFARLRAYSEITGGVDAALEERLVQIEDLEPVRDPEFIEAVTSLAPTHDYLGAIQSLSDDQVARGQAWLTAVAQV